jgi:hypothetical protein
MQRMSDNDSRKPVFTIATRLAVLLMLLCTPRWVTAEAAPTAQSTAAPTVATGTSTTQTELPFGSIVADSFFPWVSKDPKVPTRWTDGIVHFFLGLIGALVTVYLFLGESLPSMGGKAKYDLVEQELQDFKSRREKALKAREEYARGETEPPLERLEAELRLSNDYERTIRRLEAQLAQERWNLFLVGFPVYLLLGGFFASAFATNLLQALLIGFGWTALADRIGLRRELDSRKQMKDEQINKIEAEGLEQAKKRREEASALQAKIDSQKQLIAQLVREVAAASRGPRGGGAGGPPAGGTPPQAGAPQ